MIIIIKKILKNTQLESTFNESSVINQKEHVPEVRTRKKRTRAVRSPPLSKQSKHIF